MKKILFYITELLIMYQQLLQRSSECYWTFSPVKILNKKILFIGPSQFFYQIYATVQHTFRITAMKEHLTNHALLIIIRLKSGFWAPVNYVIFKSWNGLKWKLLSIYVHAVSLFYFTEYFCYFNVIVTKISRDWPT